MRNWLKAYMQVIRYTYRRVCTRKKCVRACDQFLKRTMIDVILSQPIPSRDNEKENENVCEEASSFYRDSPWQG